MCCFLWNLLTDTNKWLDGWMGFSSQNAETLKIQRISEYATKRR